MNIDRREFLATGATLAAFAAVGEGADPAQVVGPLVGHTETSSAMLWARFPAAGRHTISVGPADGTGKATEYTAVAAADGDFTARWVATGLNPATRYKAVLKGGRPCEFTTPPKSSDPAKVTIAFGSCALEDAGSRKVWTRMQAEQVDAVVLCGDTPYIDSTALDIQRRRHREFAGVPEYQQLLSTRPFWSTWDDHDFGKNDADGMLKGKENSRRAFMEYRAQPSYGDGQGGIYTSFRWGPVEVFLIDARWWSFTGPSFADAKQKTLLGQAQWDWLKKGLAESTAPFKVLVAGMIWDDKKNKEKDDWEHYPHEKAALFQWIREKKIGGVTLFGGDIHVTRLLRYASESVGYPLYEFISSPMHAKTIAGLNVPHPDLLHSKLQPNTFMTLTADTTVTPAVLTARFLDTDGQSIFPDTAIKLDELTPPKK